MPTSRAPKGVLVRQTAEWFYHRAYSVNFPIIHAVPSWVSYLYNGAIDGSLLYIYGINATLNNGTSQDNLSCYLVQTPTGVNLSSAVIYPVYNAQPASPAQFWVDFAYASGFFNRQFAVAIEGVAAGLFPPAPLQVLRPGYGLQMVQTLVATDFFRTIWFLWITGE